MNPTLSWRVALAAALSFTLAACGGGGGGLDGGTGGTGVSTGVMTKGSVIVNGVRFEDTTANITIDDTPKTASALQNGMVVKVRGRFNADGTTGTAERIEVENEARGTVQTKDSSTNPPRFTVVGQVVLVDDETIAANFAAPPANAQALVAALVTGTSVVEVHGQRDGSGNIRASRVELLASPGANVDELRGRVKAGSLTGSGFVLSNSAIDVTVNFGTGHTISPTGAALANGALVEVHGSFSGGIFTASRTDVEDLEDNEFEPAENEDYEVEGFVAGCPANDICGNTFTVDGKNVEKGSNVRYEGGTKDDLRNGAKVEAEGHWVAGTLRVDKFKFKRTRVILTGNATAVSSSGASSSTIEIGDTGTVTVLGTTVQITTVTKVDTSDGITAVERVEVRGYVDKTGNVIAEEIKDNVGSSGAILQARVSAESGNVLTMLGISVDVGGATYFEQANEQPFTGTLAQQLAAFLNAVTPASATPPGTLVKVKGPFTAGTIAATEAEIQDD